MDPRRRFSDLATTSALALMLKMRRIFSDHTLPCARLSAAIAPGLPGVISRDQGQADRRPDQVP